jgi:hypothetical protein
MRKRLLAACLAAGTSLLAASSEYPTPEIREEQEIVVRGVTETWQLKWTTAPKPVCGPDDIAALTIPCTGFAYGEGGDLVLIRLRSGFEIDRLQLTPLFDEILGDTGRIAVVQRWQPDDDNDFEAALNDDDFPDLVAKRPAVQVMHFADYDHDGEASEFYLQTATPLDSAPNAGVVIGTSRKYPWLHVFGTASEPLEPLYLQKQEWNALRDSSGPIEVNDWPCEFQGGDTEIKLLLRWTPDGIEGATREFTCAPEPRRLINEQPL